MSEPDFVSCASRLAGIMGLAFGWQPDVFWCATPAEVGALVAALQDDGVAGLSGSELARLMEALPDG